MITNFNHEDEYINYKFLPSNEIDVKPSIEITIVVTVTIILLSITTSIIGYFAVTRIRILFQENYWKNTHSIVLSIILSGIANVVILCWTLVRL